MKKFKIAKFLVIALVLGGGLFYGTQMVQKNQENRSNAAGGALVAEGIGKLVAPYAKEAIKGLKGNDPMPTEIYKSGTAVCGLKSSCESGTYAPFSSDDKEIKWTCQKGTGLKLLCKYIKPKVDGLCSTDRNKCRAGTFKESKDSEDHYYWLCEGINGGSSPLCNKPKLVSRGGTDRPIKGVCGETKNSCSTGKWSETTDTTTAYKWKCNTTVCLKDKAPLCGVYAFDGKPIKTASCYVGSLDRPNFGLAIYDVTINGKKYKAWYCKNGSSKVSCTNKTPSINY